MSAIPTLLTGDGAFANVREILKGIELKQLAVRPDVSPHSIYEELWHMVYWQNLLLEWVSENEVPLPKDLSESWPKSQGPEDLREARDLLRSFFEGVNKASAIASDSSLMQKRIFDKYTIQSLIETILTHNSYHLGKIVLLRQLIGIWESQD